MKKQLTIYYTSDVHGYFSPIDYASGNEIPSGLANCISNFEKDGNTLIIDGGDILQGSPFTYYLYNKRKDDGCLPAEIMNIGGYDFVTLGNHDFNYGKEELEKYISALDARCLCANIAGIRGVEKTAIVTLQNGLRVGLAGVTTHYVKLWEKPENLAGIAVTDAFTAAKEAYEQLKAKADITVCIYHGGFERDVKTGKVLSDTDENQGWRICEELGFDILLAGHQHTAAENVRINGTYTCQPPDKARQYIKMDVIVDGQITTEQHLMDAGNVTQAKAKALLLPAEKQAAAWFDTPMGHLDTPLLPSRHIDMAANGSLIANFFNQVQLEASGADISATSLGNSVKGLGKDVTIRDIVSTYVFPNTLKTVEVCREQLKKALERSAEYFTRNEDGTLRISDAFLKPKVEHYNYDYYAGVSYAYDITKPVGKRVAELTVNGAPVKDTDVFTACLSSYRASGTGGYDCYVGCPVVREIGTEMSDLLLDYFRQYGGDIPLARGSFRVF